MSSVIVLLVNTLNTFLSIYLVLIFIRILLSWFPNVNWYDPPFSILAQLTDPYLNVFRSIIPPIGGMDFSPILAIILLNVLQAALPALLGLFAYQGAATF